jgi:hypothetical protein
VLGAARGGVASVSQQRRISMKSLVVTQIFAVIANVEQCRFDFINKPTSFLAAIFFFHFHCSKI